MAAFTKFVCLRYGQVHPRQDTAQAFPAGIAIGKEAEAAESRDLSGAKVRREVQQLHQRLRFGGEVDTLRLPNQIQRFFAEDIGGQMKSSVLPKREGEHAVERIEAFRAPCAPCLQQHFGIAPAIEDGSNLLQSIAQFRGSCRSPR